MNQISAMSLAVDKPLVDRRRAVYTALVDHLSEEEVLESLIHWEDAYANEPRFFVQNYLADVLNTPKLRLLRLRLLQVLLKAMTLPSASLLPDPHDQVWAYRMRRSKAVAAQSGDNPVITACGLFLASLLSQLDEGNRARTRHFVLDQLDRSKLANATRAAVRNWITDPARVTLMGAVTTELPGLVSMFYIGLCEFIGPVAADAALNRAFKRVEAENPALAPHARGLL